MAKKFLIRDWDEAMAGFGDTDKIKRQYATAQSFDIRILLHQLFSTNAMGWPNWVFKNYQLEEGQRILELGCGSASIWESNARRIPSGIRLILSDLSQKMLDTARENTAELDFIDYQVIDAQAIPYPDDSFDIVIANHMLYYVPNIDRALQEISRVLRPDGVLYATTIGKNNLLELGQLLSDFDDRIVSAQGAVAEVFGLETGGAKLARYFGAVEIRRYEDSLHITQPWPLISYVLSAKSDGNTCEIISDDQIERFARYIDSIFDEQAYIDIQKDAGMFVAKRPES